MTIPQHIIDIARDRFYSLHPGLFSEDERIAYALESVVKDIWWNGYHVGEQDSTGAPSGDNGTFIRAMIDTTDGKEL